MEFVEIGFGDQSRILSEIKEYSNLSWNSIDKLLGVTKRMRRLYQKEKCRIPLFRLEALCEKVNFDKRKLKVLKITHIAYSYEKNIVEPELDENLAEFLGTVSGDGNIDPNNYRVSVTCNAITDRIYVSYHTRNKFKDLFGLDTTIDTRNGGIRCQSYCKKLAKFMVKNGITPGNRKNRTFIPAAITQHKILLCAFLRGVFDTDGSLHRHREDSAAIEFISLSPVFLRAIKDSLRSLGFDASLSGKSVYIYDQKQVDTFFKLIKPNNPKHIWKYIKFKETGKVPKHKEVIKASVV